MFLSIFSSTFFSTGWSCLRIPSDVFSSSSTNQSKFTFVFLHIFRSEIFGFQVNQLKLLHHLTGCIVRVKFLVEFFLEILVELVLEHDQVNNFHFMDFLYFRAPSCKIAHNGGNNKNYQFLEAVFCDVVAI